MRLYVPLNIVKHILKYENGKWLSYRGLLQVLTLPLFRTAGACEPDRYKVAEGNSIKVQNLRWWC